MFKELIDKQLFGFNKEAFELELKSIFDWWTNNILEENGFGFIGRIDGLGHKYPEAPKSVILNTRILWAFSAASRLGYKEYMTIANKAFDFLEKHFIDRENGGLYWMLDAGGTPIDVKKQVYAQAFGIYAFTEYYLCTGESRSLEMADNLFQLIESHCKDNKNGGYFEAKTQTWQVLSDVALSEKEGNDAKTMNTHLHLMEAYTNLVRCTREVKYVDALDALIRLYVDKFVDQETFRLKLFFDENWNENESHESFGHEIESAWLLNEACEVLGDDVLASQIQRITTQIALRVKEVGIDDNGAIHNDRHSDGHYDVQRDWWPQAEGVVGYFDAYQKTYSEAFLETANDIWTYIQLYIKDYENGEWFWACSQAGIPNIAEDKAGPWKAPYHNGRMCIEMIKRLSNH